jgi:hypothetical protein
MNQSICRVVTRSHGSLLARLHETQFSRQLLVTLIRCLLAPGLSFIDRAAIAFGMRGTVSPIRGKPKAVRV